MPKLKLHIHLIFPQLPPCAIVSIQPNSHNNNKSNIKKCTSSPATPNSFATMICFSANKASSLLLGTTTPFPAANPEACKFSY